MSVVNRAHVICTVARTDIEPFKSRYLFDRHGWGIEDLRDTCDFTFVVAFTLPLVALISFGSALTFPRCPLPIIMRFDLVNDFML